MALRMFVRVAELGAWLAALGLAGCEAHIDYAHDDPIASHAGNMGETARASTSNGKTPEDVLASPACARPAPGRAPLRRLSNAEYRNTISDLLGDSPKVQALIASATHGFPSETESLGFRNNADYLDVSTFIAQGYVDAAEQFLDSIASNPEFVPCTPTSGTELDCARTFISRFGLRAFRRPLSPEESAQYEALFQKSLAKYDFPSAIRTTAFAFLQSPKFLYRPEFGAEPGALGAPSPYEMARRLSYLFWQSMPDQELFDAAAAGALASREQVERRGGCFWIRRRHVYSSTSKSGSAPMRSPRRSCGTRCCTRTWTRISCLCCSKRPAHS